jgi:hypothetical protein
VRGGYSEEKPQGRRYKTKAVRGQTQGRVTVATGWETRKKRPVTPGYTATDAEGRGCRKRDPTLDLPLGLKVLGGIMLDSRDGLQ